jgi:flagellar biosynthesis protein FlhG
VIDHAKTRGMPSAARAHGPPAPDAARMIAVGGGKGGVGKTFVTVNAAAAIAREGFEVVVVDGDLEGANLHTCFGIPPPPKSLADFVANREEDLAKLLVETGIPNLRLIAATHANLASAQPGHFQRVRLISRLRQLPADLVLIDLGAGTHPAVMDYFLVSDDGVVVFSPEPTSTENAYAFLRAAFYRRMRLAMMTHSVRALVTQAMDQRNERGIRTPMDLLREIQALDPSEGARFADAVRSFRPRLVVNEVRTADEIKLGFSVRSVCRKYFGVDAEYLGYVNHDAAVRQSVVMRRPLIDTEPNCDAAVYLRRIARKLIRTLGAPSGEGSTGL